MPQDWLDGYFENKKIVDNTVEPAGGSGEGGDMTKAVYDPANIAQQVVGTTAAQTLTNKTLTTPNLGTPSVLILTNATDATDKRLMTDAQETKLDSVATGADVTSATNVASVINSATGKTTPVDGDSIGLIDSAASNVLKNLTWANLKATLLGTGVITTAMVALNAIGNARMAKMPLGTVKVNNTITPATGDSVDMLLPPGTILYSDATGLLVPGVLGDKFSQSGDDINVLPPTSNDILAAGDFLRHNALNQIIDENDVVISGTPVVANQAALPDVVDYDGFTYRVDNQGLYGIDYQANTVWSPTNGSFLLDIWTQPTASNVAYIWPASTWNGAYTLSSAAAGAETLITGAGAEAHGLTSAVAVGKYIYVIAGTNMIGAHRITAVAVDTTGTTIQIAKTYNGANTITSVAIATTGGAAASFIPIRNITIPVLRINSAIEVMLFILSDTLVGGTIGKHTYIKLGADTLYDQNYSSSTVDALPARFIIANTGSTSLQRAVSTENSNGYVSSGTGAPLTGTTNTGAESTLSIIAGMDTANVPVEYVHGQCYIRG